MERRIRIFEESKVLFLVKIEEVTDENQLDFKARESSNTPQLSRLKKAILRAKR